jgi:hypothetical protein
VQATNVSDALRAVEGTNLHDMGRITHVTEAYPCVGVQRTK